MDLLANTEAEGGAKLLGHLSAVIFKQNDQVWWRFGKTARGP